MAIRFRTRATKVEKRTQIVRTWKEGDETKSETEDLGWYIVAGQIAFACGDVEPDFKTGDEILLTIEKR